jgi:hypothetical protein
MRAVDGDMKLFNHLVLPKPSIPMNAGCLSVYHCTKGPPTYCLRSVRARIKNETTYSHEGEAGDAFSAWTGQKE